MLNRNSVNPGLILSIFILLNVNVVFADHSQVLPELTVSGEQSDGFTSTLFNTDEISYAKPDAASALKYIPGGGLNYNGQLSGQVIYRGMFGPRMNVRINDTYINSGGPNWMDPPMHYLPGVLVDSIRVQRGIASVSSGSGIGGYVDARTKTSQFVDSDDMVFHGELQLDGHSVDGGLGSGGIVGLSNRNHRVHFLGSFEHGNDLESGDDDIRSTEYRRVYGGLGYGYHNGVNEFKMDIARVDSGPAGTPTLPMDIDFLKSNFFNTAFTTRLNRFDIKLGVNVSNIEHKMDNFTLRPTPDFSALPLAPFVGTDERFVRADAEGFGYDLTISTAFMGGNISLGTDGHQALHNAIAGDPAVTAFFITNFNDVEVDQYGFFTEWINDRRDRWDIEAGLRLNVVNTDAGRVNAFPAVLADTGAVVNGVTTGAQTLRNNFNNADRSKVDVNLDAVLKLDYALTQRLTIELGFARKVRSPSYIERYLWIPLEVNAGLGDGNNYIGNPNLDPEKSHQVELGLHMHTSDFYLTPRVYYRRVDDYIQGTAAANVSAITFSTLAAGDPTPLIFTNVDAEIYGVDADFGYGINRNWRLDGALSYTRGKRRDIDDDLYRIAPLNGRLGLTYNQADWSVTVEGVAAAKQHDISDTITADPPNANNNNEATSGYALLNMQGRYHIANTGFRVQAGIENVLDHLYTDHLSGFNRNRASDVDVGQRLPGPGRNVFTTVSYQW